MQQHDVLALTDTGYVEIDAIGANELLVKFHGSLVNTVFFASGRSAACNRCSRLRYGYTGTK